MSVWRRMARWFRKEPERSPFWNFDRCSPRYPITLFVQPPGSDTAMESQGDIGIDGFSFKAIEGLAENMKIGLSFLLPDNHMRIEATGEIIKVDDAPDGHTVRGRFISITLEDRRLIARWIYESFLNDQKR